jgi:hypothetical protein
VLSKQITKLSLSQDLLLMEDEDEDEEEKEDENSITEKYSKE